MAENNLNRQDADVETPCSILNHTKHQAKDNPSAIEETCYQALVFSITLQIIFLFFSALILDGGKSLGLCIFSAKIYWILAFIIMIRRFNSPTKMDIIIIKYAFIFFMAFWIIVNVVASFL
jgi:hypothetical protein